MHSYLDHATKALSVKTVKREYLLLLQSYSGCVSEDPTEPLHTAQQ